MHGMPLACICRVARREQEQEEILQQSELSRPTNRLSYLPYMLLSVSGTRYASVAWWNAAMGNSNSFDN